FFGHSFLCTLVTLSGEVLYIPQNALKFVDQTPSEVIVHSGQACTLSCSHSISSYNTILWYYQHEHGQGMHIIGYTFHSTHNLENADDKKYKLKGDAKSSVNLTISELTFKESAVYFCAASSHTYFGNGTKITVLERDVKEPEVEILKPSGIETRCKKTITLVCVAEKFYPDHVSITWTLGDKEIKENVATDPYATQDKTTKLFSMTSRLKVSKKEFKPKNKYRCTVNFYNGTHDISDNTDEINGIEGISLDIN
uniref:Ig-like domain-containing protein n=1 Tax=Cyprinus carpio carpio TaxID=630221 RepID=A0A8C1HPU4_CYPCA